ncbi:MAG: hypothetical protein Q8S32_02605 [Burkholderiaceae bacterium]|nr:hypothetical protein [Burkholderiaceae bacterium]MDZ4163458.1 hypothetical protein [Burkholderiales bacterium]
MNVSIAIAAGPHADKALACEGLLPHPLGHRDRHCTTTAGALTC